MDKSTIIAADLNTPLTALPSKQKIRTEMSTSNNTLDQMDIIDIYRAFISEQIIRAHQTFSRIGHVFLDHMTSLHKFKRTEIILSIISEHSALKLEVNCKKEVKNLTNIWRLNSTLVKND